MIVFPAIDIQGGRCVRLRQGDFNAVTTYANDPAEMAARWHSEGATWLHVVDLDGARTGSPDPQNLEALRRIIERTGLTVQFGGGVRRLEIVQRMMEVGVARVVVGTAVARDDALASRLFAEYGDRIAVGVDARDGRVAVQGWQEGTGEVATDFVQRMADLGAKRFIFTDIARDGMLQGVNAASLEQVANAVPHLPVIASGGVASLQDILTLRQVQQDTAPNIEGVIVGKALYTGAVSLPELLAHAPSGL